MSALNEAASKKCVHTREHDPVARMCHSPHDVRSQGQKSRYSLGVVSGGYESTALQICKRIGSVVETRASAAWLKIMCDRGCTEGEDVDRNTHISDQGRWQRVG
jgi:hypothetical protein